MSTTLQIMVSYASKRRRNFTFHCSTPTEAFNLAHALSGIQNLAYPDCHVVHYTINVLNDEPDK
jgi:hypothetical protein